MRTKSPTRCAAALLCCVLACVLGARRAGAQEEPQLVAPVPVADAPKAEAEAAKSVVFGRVVYDDTGRPARRVRIMLLGIDIKGPTRAAQSNARGEFRVKNVPAGRYFVAVDATGVLSPVSFLDLQEAKNGNPNLEEVGKHFQEIEVDGKGRKEVTVRAVRGAAVGGKVAYADGDPATGVTVHVLRRKGGRVTPILTGIARPDFIVRTDDRGVYRVPGLPPGEYVVGVSEAVEHGESEEARGMETGPGGSPLMMTFHPSASRPDKADSFTLEAGEEREGVDITIPARGAHAVSGVVRGRRDSRPVAGAQVTLSSEEAGMADLTYTQLAGGAQQSVSTDENGRWRFDEIPDGSYSVSVEPPVETTPTDMDEATAARLGPHARDFGRPRKKYAAKGQSFKVAGSDLLDIVVELNEGARLSGTVAFEGKELSEHMGTRFYVVTAESEAERQGINGGYVADGRFEITGIPAGKVFLRFSQFDASGTQKLYLKALTWKGRDLLREPLEVGEGAEIEGVSAVYSTAMALLRVRASGGDGKTPARGARVHLVPWDAATRARQETRLSCETDASGSCVLSGEPGEYALVALPRHSLPPGDADLNERAAKARRVTLREGENDSLEVVIQERR